MDKLDIVEQLNDPGGFDCNHHLVMEEAAEEITRLRAKLATVREEVANLHYASGCSCCRDDDGWEKAEAALGALLNIPKYEDGSGYDFYTVRDEAKALSATKGEK